MKHGIVTSKEINSDGNVILTVQSSRAGVTWKPVPVAQDHPGAIQNIEEGWHVALAQCDDGLWICMGVINTDPDQLPDSLEKKEQSMKFDDGTEISTRLNDAGDYDMTVSASGKTTIKATGDVEITSEGNALLNATGDVTIGDAANAVKLAVQNHTHDYDDSTINDTEDGSGSSSTSTKTTSPPKEAGTATLVE